MKVMKAHQSKLQLGKTTIRIMDKGIRTAGHSIKSGLTASVIREEESENERDTDAGVFLQNKRRYLQRDRRNRIVKTTSYQNAVSGHRLPDTVKTQKQHKSVAFYKSAGNGTVPQSMHVSTQAASSRVTSVQTTSYQNAVSGYRLPDAVKTQKQHKREAFSTSTGNGTVPQGVYVSTHAASTQTASIQAVSSRAPSMHAASTWTPSMHAASSQAAVSTAGNTMMQGTAAVSKHAASTGAKAAAKGTAKAAGVASGAATAGVTTGVVVVGETAKKVRRMEERMREALTAAVLGSTAKNRGKKSGTQEQTDTRSAQTGGMRVLWGIISLIFLLLLLVSTLFLSLAIEYNESVQVEEANIIEAAKKELEVSEENIGGYKYKNWFDMDANWCAMFVSWCANECGYIEAGIMPKTASVAEMQRWYISHELYQTKESGYVPKQGDIIIFKNGASHVGIVTSYDAETKMITTIEGNTGSSETAVYHKGSRVKERKYSLTNARISGYGTPEYSKADETEEEEETEENADTGQ